MIFSNLAVSEVAERSITYPLTDYEATSLSGLIQLGVNFNWPKVLKAGLLEKIIEPLSSKLGQF
jgi:hypothetical protein